MNNHALARALDHELMSLPRSINLLTRARLLLLVHSSGGGPALIQWPNNWLDVRAATFSRIVLFKCVDPWIYHLLCIDCGDVL